MAPVAPNFLELLRLLADHEIRFVVVGATAAALHGAPIGTMDLDVLIESSDDNHDRLLVVLRDLGAKYVDPIKRDIRPDAGRLKAQRLHLLETRLGRLDLLTRLGETIDWSEGLRRSQRLEIDGRSLQVLDLDAVIESKEQANRDKDRAALPVLRETLRLLRLRDAGEGEQGGV